MAITSLPLPGADPGSGSGAEGPILRFAGTGFTYPTGVEAVRSVDLDVAAGEVVAIVGPSGCGKSTLLALAADLQAPSIGEVERTIPDDGRHAVSMLFQQDTLLPWLRVRDNVTLYDRFHRGSSIEPARVDRLLRMVGLEDFAHVYPKELSGGMRRRAGFLQAIAPDPHVLLLDEPFSALDEPTRIGIHQEVFAVVRQLRTTVVLVTHDLAEAVSLADRVVILTNRPATVGSTVDVPFGDSRDMLALREDPEFLQLYGHLWHELRMVMGAGGAGGGGGGAG